MATCNYTSSSDTWGYYSFKTNGSESSGYKNTFSWNGRAYLGEKSSSGNDCGTNAACFCIYFYNLENRDKIKKVTNFSFDTFAHKSDSGYAGCVAKVQYMGQSPSNPNALWRLGNDTISFTKNSRGYFSTSDTTACANITNLIQSATSGKEYWFRLVRVSGSGTELRDNIYVTITYEDGTKAYIYIGSEWKEGTPYIYNGTAWVPAQPKIYTSSAWT